MRNARRLTGAMAIAMLLPVWATSRAKAAEVVVASDNFNRADESPLTVGGNWQRFSLGGVANLAGNQIAGVSGDALYYWQGSGLFDNARQFSRVKVTNAAGQVGLAGREQPVEERGQGRHGAAVDKYLRVPYAKGVPLSTGRPCSPSAGPRSRTRSPRRSR